MAIKIALAGNPNCGKTTMFNALTGANQYVGNWPGVTVEKKEGKLKSAKSGEEIIITDLPGVYSLSPYTLEEVVSRDYLVHEKPQAIINLVGATNIERNLYLTTQILEIGIPVVIALNMADLLAKSGDKIDVKKLSEIFGCEVVETSALKGTGLKEVVEKAIEAAKKNEWKNPAGIFSGNVENAIAKVEEAVGDAVDADQKRWFAIKLLEKDSKVIEQLHLPASAMAAVNTEVTRLEKEQDDDTESIITDERYTYIGSVIDKSVKKSGKKLSTSDKIDKIVTNRILGIPIFAAVMWFVYYICVSTLGTMGTDWANDTFGGGIQEWAGAALAAAGASDFIQSLVVDGILGGLFAVFGFLPQMALLFLMLSILEDCGYMVRIAFVMDRVFRHFGLSGKSFIPLLIASGCGIPGIMASKTIENDNDRRLTIMTATFIPCGAKLPVIALLGGIMVGWTSGDYSDAGNTAFLMYALGIVCVLVAAIMLKKTKPFSGKPAPFVMFREWFLRYGRRYRKLLHGDPRKRSCMDLHSSRMGQMAVRCSGDLRILRKRGYRFHNGCPCKCQRGSLRGDRRCRSRDQRLVPDNGSSLLLPCIQPVKLPVSGGYFHNGPADAVQKVVLACNHLPERIRLLCSTDVLPVRTSYGRRFLRNRHSSSCCCSSRIPLYAVPSESI